MSTEYFETDLEDALDIAGVGKYQILHCLLMMTNLSSALLEIIGPAFVLPATACDLDLPDTLKGILASIPSIGVILTTPLLGRAADTLGRKPVLLYSSVIAGVCCLLAAFMPTLVSFAVCKFIGSLFLSSPSSLGWAYAGEMVPKRRRDSMLLICNSFQMMASALSPIIAWAILSSSWRYQLGYLDLRPWRLLTAVYALPLILSALWMIRADESPKFLMAKGERRQALEILRKIYTTNKGMPWKSYCVISLKGGNSENMSADDDTAHSAFELLRISYLKWLGLCGFLMFGIFSVLNGLFLFIPDAINKIMSGTADETVCIIMNHIEEKKDDACTASMSVATFTVMVVTTAVYGLIILAISFCSFNKRNLLITMFSSVGTICFVSGLSTNKMVAGLSMTGLQMTALGVGVLTAYVIHLFPTRLRGTAVGAILMFGRLGSVLGASAAGNFLPAACTITFYGFAILLFACAGLSFLLPKHHGVSTNGYLDTDTR